MTAFARAATTLPYGTLVWELKSVNGKGLDIRLRVPPGCDALETACRGLIGSAVTRGSVQATLSQAGAGRAPAIRVDRELLRSLIDALAEAVPPGAAVGPVTLDGLLAVRGVVEVSEAAEQPEDRAALGDAAIALLRGALADLLTVRRTEGAALGTLLRDHLAAIEGLTEAADKAPGRSAEAIAAKLARAVAMAARAGPTLDPDRLHQEALILATRADVCEELDRLAIHARAARELLHGGGPVGRRLDFLAQELAREANTLCAKSGDAALTAIGLDLRNRIEQFREQVQNLE